MGGRRGQLGLLTDIGTDHEIESLCSEWTLPPTDEESEDDDNDDDNDHNMEDVIVVQHVEWVCCKRTRVLSDPGVNDQVVVAQSLVEITSGEFCTSGICVEGHDC